VVTTVDSLALGVDLDTGLTVKFSQTVEIDLGSLHYLDLTDVAVLNGVDWLSGLGDISSNAIGQQLLDQFWDVAVADLADDDLGHLLSDLFDLLALGVGGLLYLTLGSLFGEGNDENSKMVVISGLGIDLAFDHGLPLLNHTTGLVSGEVHTVEVEHAVLTLDIFAHQFELSEAGSIVLEVGLVAVEHSALETVGGDLVTDGSGDQGLADLSDLEHTWSFDVIPVLLGEGVDDLLLTSLLGALRHTLVLPHGHDDSFFFGSFLSVSST